MRTRVPIFSFLVLLTAASLQGAVSLPSLISDHMMLQQDVPVRIWGKANPGEFVTVEFRGQTVSSRAGSDGRWEAFLRPMAPGEPASMRIEGDNSITVRDVLVGEVWVGSGQSNMVMTVARSNDPEKEAAAANYPQIRLFKVELATAEKPAEDFEGEWQVCTPVTIPQFSAAAYYFGRKLHQDLGVPVGLIQTAWGGTPVQAWTSREALRADPRLHTVLRAQERHAAEYPGELARHKQSLAAWEAARARGEEPAKKPQEPRAVINQWSPVVLYNAMVAPLVPYTIRGVIWYQGEWNASRGQGYLYRTLLTAMIQDWRDRWGIGEFPFLVVQLANFRRGGEGAAGWPLARESQSEALRLRNTGLAVTIDIGNPTDIHPKNKQDVGKRLALWALANTYGKQIVYSGPLYRRMTTEPGKIRVWFDHVGGGLRAEGGSLKGFTIAGADRVFVPAAAAIDGGTVVVSSAEVSEPQAVRYAWKDDPENTLRNAEGLPASPFRTDNWTNGLMP